MKLQWSIHCDMKIFAECKIFQATRVTAVLCDMYDRIYLNGYTWNTIDLILLKIRYNCRWFPWFHLRNYLILLLYLSVIVFVLFILSLFWILKIFSEFCNRVSDMIFNPYRPSPGEVLIFLLATQIFIGKQGTASKTKIKESLV